MRLWVDFENHGERFWDNLRLDLRINELGETRREGPMRDGVSLRRLLIELVNNDEVCGTDEDIHCLHKWLSETDGFYDPAPSFAPYPVMISDD